MRQNPRQSRGLSNRIRITHAITERGPMFIQPYLYFNGRCEEAINFYKQSRLVPK